ncbi:hypothetical protein NTE28_003576 [Vibrio harveyi]|nr:hypothetical protein [Vibrio harveyi]
MSDTKYKLLADMYKKDNERMRDRIVELERQVSNGGDDTNTELLERKVTHLEREVSALRKTLNERNVELTKLKNKRPAGRPKSEKKPLGEDRMGIPMIRKEESKGLVVAGDATIKLGSKEVPLASIRKSPTRLNKMLAEANVALRVQGTREVVLKRSWVNDLKRYFMTFKPQTGSRDCINENGEVLRLPKEVRNWLIDKQS